MKTRPAKPRKPGERKRPYDTTNRDAAKAETRDRIVRALVRVIREDGVHAFTMQRVAERAGIALRTVYRHFDSREQLLEGLSDLLDREVAAAGMHMPTNVEELKAAPEPMYRYFDVIKDPLAASVVAAMATGYRTRSQLQRWAYFEAMLAEAHPTLGAGELREATAIFLALASSRTWYTLTREIGLDAEEGGRAVGWGVRTLLADLARRGATAPTRRKTPRSKSDDGPGKSA
jgi:AcrR family transcriptional regulator